MMRNFLFSVLATWVFLVQSVSAQESVYVQIESQPSLSAAEDSLRGYASRLPDVNGFDLGRGWYGIALGPYPRDEANRVLRTLRAQRLIPSDSYLEGPDRYGQRIWPIGAGPATVPAVTAPEITAQPEPQEVDETPREARASEALLSREEREALQIALRWAGYYNAAIDGAFGRGTRSSMAEWQTANGFEPTGVLTTAQRAELFRQYNAVLEGMDIQTVRDTRAGISIDLPLGAVAFDRYDSPFAHFDPTGTVDGARVLLISQPGDRDRLAGLYEIMQTLDIVPLDGPRERNRDSFTLTGQDSRIVSHTEARLDGDAIKGFTLVWPAGDEERRRRILAAMQSSFAPIDGVLDPAVIAEDSQSVDLVAGLAIRQPKLTASGFFVDRQGRVLTTASAVENCSRITLNSDHDAEILAKDIGLGLAVLQATQPLAPTAIAQFRETTPRLQSEIAVAGYSFGGVLPAATMTFGRLADLRGLNGEETLSRLAISTLDGDAGGPVVDDGGAVLGMLIPHDAGGRQLPDEVNFATKSTALREALSRAGISAQSTPNLPRLDPVDLTAQATAMTVLVSCWE
ncbi:trypsin-like peptidase domain-containing protein [Marivita geojedonensis]|uniref:Peptidoglycan-binding protein n=1 Tax=Marivita geojedonensis TaxID=1123756 RepID=A0A1X4NLL2_9RHOB|nr:trypsin-like peptidase domain-containing protein [Marivita geojedonensis]OSQ51197.1 peptidoglycan-binding protein [Marivita geojedonensis]PRY78549.1 putative peptidoglycan binding protein [Marivita geojedonensis]